MFRPYAIVVAFLVVLTSGIVHGVWANRWGPSAELERARERMEQVPVEFGEWEMVGESQVSLKEQQIAGIVGYKRRDYRHKRTRQDVSVLLVCGRPGAIAVHTPDVCFEGAGFVQAGAPAKDTLALPGGARRADLHRGRFTKPVAGVPRHLLAFWSWNAGGAWEAPDKPRFHFLGARVLHKLYVSREVPGEEAETEPCVEFLREFLPVLQQSLFAPPPEVGGPERT